jgi:hypothetical protein
MGLALPMLAIASCKAIHARGVERSARGEASRAVGEIVENEL